MPDRPVVRFRRQTAEQHSDQLIVRLDSLEDGETLAAVGGGEQDPLKLLAIGFQLFNLLDWVHLEVCAASQRLIPQGGREVDEWSGLR